MGNGNSKTIEVGRKIEDAIRFKLDRVEFDGDVGSHLEKIKDEIEKTGHSIFWNTERIVDPFSGTLTETQYGSPFHSRPEENSPYLNSASKTAMYASSSQLKTIVLIKPTKELQEVPKINWESILNKK